MEVKTLITIKYQDAYGKIWDTEEEAIRANLWKPLDNHLEDYLEVDSYEGARVSDVLDWLKRYPYFIYSELRKIIPKEQLKELDKE